jgi:putative addiction module killer protein
VLDAFKLARHCCCTGQVFHNVLKVVFKEVPYAVRVNAFIRRIKMLYLSLARVLHICYTFFMNTVKIIVYSTDTDKEPFTEWYRRLDTATRPIISEKLARLRNGNFGTCKPIKEHAGIYELVINYGPGYRIYYGKQGDVLVILLIGGEKKSQERDIDKAYRYWLDYKGE